MGTAAQFSQFSADVYCGQTAGWIKMPLGTEVSLGLGHIALDGDPAPQKGARSPIFRPMSIVTMSATAEHLSNVGPCSMQVM